MSGFMNDPSIFGLQLAKDGSDGNQAYKTNGVRAATLCGHMAVSDTAILMMGVRYDAIRSSYDINDKRFNSAMCVEWYARGIDPKHPPSVLVITEALLTAFALYFGARTIAEAKDPAWDGHQFLKDVFEAPLGAEIWIQWDEAKR